MSKSEKPQDKLKIKALKPKRTVLCFVIDQQEQQLLMILKKRGQGAGKWNMPGGKVHENETLEAAAIRETKEETGITTTNLEKIGELEFFFPKGNSWNNHCTVFRAYDFSGRLQASTDECDAHWVKLAEIPFSKMWDSDQRWIHLVFEGRDFHRQYTFDEQDQFQDEKILF